MNAEARKQSAPQMAPHSRPAERSLLGALLRDNGAIDAVSALVAAEDFYADAHRKLFAAVLDLHDRRQPADAVTLADELNRRGQVEDVGGYGCLGELWELSPTGANALHYARIVKAKALLREVIRVGTDMVRAGFEQSAPAEEILDSAERAIFAASRASSECRASTLAEAVDEASDAIDRRSRSSGPSGVPTGFADLDELLDGFQPSELTVIAARPSVGKTSVGLALLRHAVDSGAAAFFASLEQSRAELAERLLAAEARVDTHRLRRAAVLGAGEWSRLSQARSLLRDRRLYIADSSRQSAARIATNARRLRLREDVRLVLVDYLQLVEPEDRRVPRHEQVGATMKRFKALAKELAVPVVVLAQLNRQVEGRSDGRPRLADLRESGDVEQDADVVWLLSNPHPPQAEPAWGARTLIVDVAKNRNGRCADVVLRHYRAQMRFEPHHPHDAETLS